MESIVQFGPDGRLFGLLSGEPDGNSTTLVLLNAGTIPRAGPFRLHVELARRLEPKPVFRFDLPGIGEAPRMGSCTALEATRAALDCLEERYGCKRFIVGGLCSAADLGWRVAECDPRVAGVLLLDGLSFTGPWFAWARACHALRRSPLRWPGMARRLFSQKLNPASAPAVRDFRDWPSRELAQGQLQKMLKRDVRMLFVYTGSASDRFLDRRQFAWAFGKSAHNGGISLYHWPDCDHLFYRRGHRERLLDTVTRWLQTT